MPRRSWLFAASQAGGAWLGGVAFFSPVPVQGPTDERLVKVVDQPPAMPDDAVRSRPTPRLATLANDVIRLGVDLDRGGAIALLQLLPDGPSVVNVRDLGRYIGPAFYSGPTPYGQPHPAWPNWPWNAVMAGDVAGRPARCLEHRRLGDTLFVRSQPSQWALNDVPAEAEVETRITLEGHAAHVRQRFLNRRSDRTLYPPRDQELPAVYTTGGLHRLVSYTGDRPFTDAAPGEIPRRVSRGNQPSWNRFDATEQWAALVDHHGWGLGVVHPGVVRWLGGFFGDQTAGGPADNPTGYLAPVRPEVLDHDLEYEFEYWLVLGDVEAIRRHARRVCASKLPTHMFRQTRNHWTSLNLRDRGWPLDDRWRLEFDQPDPQLLGPETFWHAEQAPTLRLRAAFGTQSRTCELFWERFDRPGFHPEQSLRLPIEPDGLVRDLEFSLAQSPAYHGPLRRLRLDPVDNGSTGLWCELESIALLAPA